MGVDASLTSVPQFDTLEIVRTGIVTMTIDGGSSDDVTFAHNLGYVPLAFIYLDGGGGFIPLPYLQINSSTLQNVYYGYVDTTTIYISRLTVGGPAPSAGTANFRYYLLRSKANAAT